MHNLPVARTLTRSSRYVCLSCRLRHPTFTLDPHPQSRTYASKGERKNTDNEAALKDDTVAAVEDGQPKKSLVPGGGGAKSNKKVTSRNGPGSPPAKKETAIAKMKSTTSVQKKPPPATSKVRKPTTKEMTEVSEHVPEGKDAAAEAAKKPNKVKKGKAERKQEGAVALKTTGDDDTPITEAASSNAKPGKSKVKPTTKPKKALRLKEVSVDSTNTEVEAGPPVRKFRESVATSNKIAARELRQMRAKGFRKIAAQLQRQGKSPAQIRKFESIVGLNPEGLDVENKNVAQGAVQRGTHTETATRKRGPGARRGLQAASINAAGVGIEEAMKKASPKADDQLPTMRADEVALDVIPVPQPPVPQLAHGLERVLFNPGVYHVRDPRTRTFNFDPHLEKLMPVRDFNFDSLNIFTPPSKDEALANIARQSAKRYVASTSSLTGVLKHFHYLLSQWRPINFNLLSKGFPTILTSFTKLNRAPDAVFLRWKNGVYAVDSDKYYDSANVLSLMGRYMEKLLTVGKERFFRHKVGSDNPITDRERSEPEAYHYSTLGDFVLRSQLDAHDARLPGTGIFDLKTRAVVPIRMDAGDYEWGMDYEIRSIAGEWQSFEREYHDMVRSTMLKYSLQVRMGRMDGIFIAFHNIARIFGFQYISLEEMDNALHGQWNRTLGDQEFLLSTRLMNEVFNKATEKFPETSLRFHFETRPSTTDLPFMYIFAEPVTEEQTEAIQTANRHKIEEWERSILHGAPTEAGQAKKGEANEHGEEDAQDKMVEDAVYNIDQDVTSELMREKDEQARKSEAQTDADKKPELEPTSGPLAVWVLTINNRVNGQSVTRPRNPHTDKDTWEIAYSLVSIETPERAWQLYSMCKARREKEYSEEKKLTQDNDYFKSLLRRVTADGKKWRERVQAREDADREQGRAAKVAWDETAHMDGSDESKKQRTSSLWDWFTGPKS